MYIYVYKIPGLILNKILHGQESQSLHPWDIITSLPETVQFQFTLTRTKKWPLKPGRALF